MTIPATTSPIARRCAPGIAPGGIWSVLYKGLARTFTVPTFDANRSFVLIVPTVSLDRNNNLTQVNW